MAHSVNPWLRRVIDATHIEKEIIGGHIVSVDDRGCVI